MKTINTSYFGVRVIEEKKPIEGIPGLYIGKIKLASCMLLGIIDENNNEVVPFGFLERIQKITILNEKNIVIDHYCIIYKYGEEYNRYGSVLIIKRDGKFEFAFDSNAGIFNIDDNKLVGAHVNRHDLDADLEILEYNYQKDIEYRHLLMRSYYNDDRLDEYLSMRVSPNTLLSRRLRSEK